jgi:hypothetical protein
VAIYGFPLAINAHFLLLVRSHPKLHYLSDALPTVPPSTRRGYYCQTCRDTILQTEEIDNSVEYENTPGTPHQRTRADLWRSALEGCRICSAVVQHRSRMPRDVWGTLLFWRPVTSYKRHFREICVKSRECRDSKINTCKFDLVDSSSKPISQ